MKRPIKIAFISALSFFSLTAVTVATVAWFSSITNVSFGDKDSPKVRAGMETFPYESGSGTENDPYIITRRNHLYNLAWKQYLGHYNIDASTQQPNIQRCYFELRADIDMSGITLPPIGTDTFPFYGYFDGNGHTVSNLTITNDDPKRDGTTEFGIARPGNAVIPSYAVPSKIVGFFGVVGNLPEQTVSYSSHAPSVSDVLLDNLIVRSKTSQTLIGLAAGYVDGSLSGVKVGGESKIDISGQTSGALTSITDKLSDYGLVGYTTNKASNGTFVQKLSEYYDSVAASGSGHGANWGNSIDMLSLYNRLSKVYNEDSYDNGDFTVEITTDPSGNVRKQKIESTNESSNPINHYAGYSVNDHSYTFNKHNKGSQDFYYLYGDFSPASGTKTSNNYTEAYKNVTSSKITISQTDSGYYIKAGNYYVKMPTLTSLSNDKVLLVTTNQADATIFSRTANTVNGQSGYRYFCTQTVNGNSANIYFGINAEKNTSSMNLIAVGYNPNTTARKKITTYFTDGTGTYHYRYTDTTKCYISYSGGNFITYYGRLNGTAANAQEMNITRYLGGNKTDNCFSTENSLQAMDVFYENNKLFTCIDGDIYYFSFNGSRLSIDHLCLPGDSPNWTYSGGALYFTYSSTTYYLTLTNANLVSTSSFTNVSMNSHGSANLPNQLYIASKNITSSAFSTTFKNTYLPLTVSQSDIYSTHAQNSGYIISGDSHVASSYVGKAESEYYNSGDIRVSRYDMSNINGSLGQDTYDSSRLFAITATSNSDFKYVTDTYNSGHTPSGTISSQISSSVNANALNRYYDWGVNTGARVALGNVFDGDSDNIFGLHFMDATISANNTVTVPNAVINGTTYTNGLTMPKDCIDFRVKENGYITFFAGTYFPNNSAFFSLHKIERDGSNNISSITEIDTIYVDDSNHYYYNPASTAGLTKVFDTAVLTSPSSNYFIQNAVYYFEIPVSAGEYALGSVPGKDGAYLMYLDISASGIVTVDDSFCAYSITTEKTSDSYPSGVDFNMANTGSAGGDTFGIYIPASSSGIIVFNINEEATSIAINDSSHISTYSFHGTKYGGANPDTGQFSVTGTNLPSPIAEPPEGGERILYLDIEKSNGESYHVHIIDYLTDSEGTFDESDSVFLIDNVSSSKASVLALSGMIDNSVINSMRGLTQAAALTRDSGTSEFVTTYDTENCSFEDKTIDVDIVLNGTTIVIDVTTGYTFKVGGVQYTTSYPAS